MFGVALALLGAASDDARIAIAIDGTDVTLERFERELADARTSGAGASLADDPLAFAVTYLDKLLLGREARKIVDPSSVAVELAEARRRVVVEYYRSTKLDTIDVSPERLANIFEWNADKVRLWQIVRRTRAEADSVLRAVRAGADFGELARRTSIDPQSNTRDGDWGWMRFGEMLHVDELIWKLLPGHIAGPVETFRGWHVIRIDDRQPRGRSLMERIPHLFEAGYPDHLRRLRWYEWHSMALWRYGVELDDEGVSAACSLIVAGEAEPPESEANRLIARDDSLAFTIGDAVTTWRLSTAPPPGQMSIPHVRLWLKDRLRDRMIERDAAREGFLERPELLAAIDEAEELELVEALYAREVAAHARPSAADLERHFEASKGTFFWRKALDVSVFRTREKATSDSIAAALDAGGPSLSAEDVAAQFPHVSYRRTGPERTFDELPELGAALRRSTTETRGEMLRTVALDGLWTTARIEAVGEQTPMTFDEALASGFLEQHYLYEARAARLEAYLDSLQVAYHAVIDTPAVLGVRAAATNEDPAETRTP